MPDRDVDSSPLVVAAGPPDSRLGLLRELGEQAVLEAIFRRGPVTRPEIASATGLSKPTVGAAVGRLEQAGMISAVGPQHGRRGRSPIAYVVRDSAGFVVGLDLGGTNIRAGAADVFGEMIHDDLEPTTKAGGRALAAQLADVTTRAVERGRATHDRLLAIAISTPGVVDRETGRVRLAYNVSADGALDPLSAVGSRFGVPVLIDNNINLAALGEKSFGLARGVSTMVFIGIGAGVGMGIIMHDELVRGAHGAAGEIAYLPLVGDPFDPRHKLHGGLEDEIGAAGVLAGFAARAPGRTGEVATGPGRLRAGRRRRQRRQSGGGAHRRPAGLGHRHRVRDPRSGARRARRRDRRQPAAAAAGPRRCGCARPDPGTDRDEPAR